MSELHWNSKDLGKVTPNEEQTQNAVNAYLSTVITNPDSPPLDRTLSSNVSAAPADMVGDLKSALNDSLVGKETFITHGDFAIGGLNVDGTLKPSETMRASSANLSKLSFDRDITVSVKSGYAWGYIPFTETTPGQWAGWYTTPTKIDAGTSFVVQIRRNPESASPVANVSEFVSALTFTTKAETEIDEWQAELDSFEEEITESIDEITHEVITENQNETESFLLYSNFEHYSLNTDGTFITNEKYRVSCTDRITFDRDLNISVASGFRWGYIPYVNGAYGTWSGWKTTNFLMPSGTVFIVQIARTTESSSEIANVIEFTSAVTFRKVSSLEIQENKLAIKADESAIEYSGSKIYETTLTNGTPANPQNDECVATDYVPVVFGQTIQFITDREAETGYTYIYGIYGYNSSKTKIIELSPTARKGETSEYMVTNNSVKYIRYAVAQIAPNDSIKAIRVASFYNYFARIIVTNNVGLPYDISYYGKPINTKKGKVYISQSWISQPSPVSIDAAATQGFALYGGVVFQLYSGSSHIALIDYESGTVITTMAADVAHGNSMQFLNEFYDEDDEFPMAIIADGLTNEAYKVRVTRNSITVIETYAFDISKCGYYVSTAVDALNDIVYTIGYTNDSYTSDGSGTNRMIIAAWDINRTTAVGDDLSPLFLESFTVPFMHTIQGPTFFNGLFFVFSSPGTSQNPTKLYAIDPGEKKIVNMFDNFKGVLEEKECESLYFYEHNGNGVRCYVKGNTSSLAYYILDFNS